MDSRNSARVLLVTTFLLLAAGGAAQALISHTWVASTGNDANACTRSAPCATFAGALAKTSAGGEIDVVDAGDYGPVTITQSVTIEAVGVLATIQVSAGNAISVAAGAGDVIILRGLTLDGQGTATDGINFSTGLALYVEDCRINNFYTGLNFLPSATSKLFVNDTTVRNSGFNRPITPATGCGVYIQPGSSGLATAAIDHLRSENNTCGVKSVDNANVTIRDSVSANNGFAGFSAVQFTSAPSVLIENSLSSNNGTGALASGANAVVRLSNVTITQNQTGLATGSGASILWLEFSNHGNVTDGAPTAIIGPPGSPVD